MLVLVFPKDFEFNLFLLSCGNHVIHFSSFYHSGISNTFVLGLFDKSISTKSIWLLVTFINDSDINFYTLFGEYLNVFKSHFKEKFSSFRFVVGGTCGGSGFPELRQSFRVVTAYKIDRGIMTNSNNVFTVVLDPKLELSTNSKIEPYIALPTTETAIIVSCNFLFPSTVIPPDISKTSKHSLADMETYEFLTACKEAGVNSYTALRIVSDVPDWQPHVDEIVSYIKNNLEVIGLADTVVLQKDALQKNPLPDIMRCHRKCLSMVTLKKAVIELALFDDENCVLPSFLSTSIENYQLEHKLADKVNLPYSSHNAEFLHNFARRVFTQDVTQANYYCGDITVPRPNVGIILQTYRTSVQTYLTTDPRLASVFSKA